MSFGKTAYREVTIAAAASLSTDSFDIYGQIVAVKVPAGFEGTLVTFQSSDDNITFEDILDDAGGEIPVVVAAGKKTGLDAVRPELEHMRYGKVRAGTLGVPQPQAAQRVIRVYYMPSEWRRRE